MAKKMLITIGVLVILAIACTLWTRPAGTPQATQTNDGRYTVLVENLDTPWAMDFLPDGSLIFTERSGRVWVLREGDLLLVGEIRVSEVSESGLHGVAVDPRFGENGFVYLYYTYDGGNRVSRFVLDETLTNETVLLDGIPSARFHDGGRVRFGPDNLLYVTTGDATEPSTAQDPASLAGKILRMEPDGSVPQDNPFGNYVYSLGHRNPQGLAWSDEGELYASEHGPRRHDEINRIVSGGNYGWPETCGENPAAKDPVRCYTESTLAPAGIAWADGALYVAALRGAQLRRLVIEGDTVVDEEIILEGIGRLRDVVENDGHLYVATSNRDGRGIPAQNDDRIVRIKPSSVDE